MIDTESIRLEIVRRLPIRMHWSLGGESLDFDFSRSQSPLRPVAPPDLNGCGIETGWNSLFLFGEQDFADGGGASPYLGVHQDTGEVCGLDVERKTSPVFLLNSNIDRFIRTVQKIDEMFRHASRVPSTLSEVLTEIDPVAFERSDWKDFSSYVEAGT